jgi:uncharacterized protein (DUF433 family)
MQTIFPIEYIATNPEVRGGRPCITGTALRVIDIVMAHLYRGESVDEIALNYHLSLASVYAALSYYYDHKAELDSDIRGQVEAFEHAKEDWIANGRREILPR